MLEHNNTILNKNINVNRYIQFIEFIKDDEENAYTKSEQEKNRDFFFNLIPEIQKDLVKWQIKKQFNNDIDKYIKSRELFSNCFTLKLRNIANDEVDKMNASKSFIRNFNKKRKEALLYSSQLLKLVGKGGAKYLNDSLVNYYIDEQKQQEEFLKKFKLVNAKGKFFNLVSSEKKKERQLAQTLNISSAMTKIAKDKNFIYSLITLTLPGSMHPSPAKGSNSFSGVMPLQAQRQIQKFWEDIRANLAKKGLHSGSSYFGAITVEGHSDSTLHKHCLIYSSAENQVIIHRVVKEVQNRWAERFGEKLKFDISKYDEKKGASGATYIFKYITKTAGSIFEDGNVELKDKAIVKNMALRSFYSARSFEFFGIKKVVAKFNFLLENYKNSKSAYSADIQTMFENYDYYEFINKYEQYFKTVRDDKKKISFVLFNTSANDKKLSNNILSKKIIIEKKIFSIFETQNDFKANEVSELNKQDINNSFAYAAYENAIDKQIAYDISIDDFIKSNNKVVRMNFINDENQNQNESQSQNQSQKQDFELVTVIQSLSRKNEKAKTKDEKMRKP